MLTSTSAAFETPVATGVLLVLLAFAIGEDQFRHRIPNALILAGLILGLGLASLGSGLSGCVYAAAGALVGCTALIPFYLLRGMGAADVKLMGATGAFLGPSGALLAAALALVVGAVLAIAIVLWRLVEPRSRLETSAAGEVSAAWRAVATVLVVRKERFPYAVAIATGTVLTLWLRGSLTSLMAALGLG